MSRTQQRIEQVAGIIADNALAAATAQRINATAGWTYDVRWHDGDYINDTDYTRVEGDRLSDEQLRVALDLAQGWLLLR